MADETTPDVDNLRAAPDANSPPEAATENTPEEGEVRRPEFSTVQERGVRSPKSSIERFYDVRVPVWAELGRVEMPLGDLLELGEGSVLRLDRPIGEPVDLISQGVKLARGEVVVVDDLFAIRIREIISAE